MEFTEEFIEGLVINPEEIKNRIAEELGLPVYKVKATVDLLKEDNSVPFISRYRKEATGSLDEVEVRNIEHKLNYIENLETRRIEIIKSIFSQGMLDDIIYANIQKAMTATELEDLYAPFKKKKKTRGMKAIEKGLTPLADFMEQADNDAVDKKALEFVDEEKGVNDVEEAVDGAMDILAERAAHDIDNRKAVKENVLSTAQFVIKGLKNRETSKYQMFYGDDEDTPYRERLTSIQSNRILAVNRGEREEELETKVEYDEQSCEMTILKRYKIASEYQKMAIVEGLNRLLLPAVIREIRNDMTERAELEAISLFSKNLKNLLMQPPIKRTRILAVDPGIRTGCKAAAIDENGKFLEYFTFFNHKEDEAVIEMSRMIKKYDLQLVAIGGGTGTQDVQRIVAKIINQHGIDIAFTIVDEDGASVYSASDVAREEFPELDLTIRGAISIGRRIQDPLAEYVKIDPKSLGVGMYQHDVSQSKLSNALSESVESVVNNVGVNINTASPSLLKYVSGVSASVAKKIVKFRNEKGTITMRSLLKKIPGVGEKTFEQAAGFLKIPESSDPLDNTWVHPENYDAAREIYDKIQNNEKITSEFMKSLSEKYSIGETTINDIIDELKKPGRDPREDYPQPILSKGVVSFEDLKVGMKVKGKVKNVVNFGAFVDIGIKESALLHISEMSDTFVSNPSEVLKVGDVAEYKIIEIDRIRKRISLSAKSETGQRKTTGKPAQKKFDYSKYIL